MSKFLALKLTGDNTDIELGKIINVISSPYSENMPINVWSNSTASVNTVQGLLSPLMGVRTIINSDDIIIVEFADNIESLDISEPNDTTNKFTGVELLSFAENYSFSNADDFQSIGAFDSSNWDGHGHFLFSFIDTVFIYPLTAEEIADQEKILISSLKLEARLGSSMTLEEVVTLFLTNSDEATTAINVLSAGGTFDELRTAGLSELESMRVMALFNMMVDPVRYESERALGLLLNSPENLVLFKAYLVTLSIDLPPMDKYLSDLRADQDVYNAARDWEAQLAV